MRRAINTPARGVGAKTEQALEALADSARKMIPGLTVPEVLVSLLEDVHLDELETVLARSAEGGGTAAMETATPSPQEGKRGGGVGMWPEEIGDGGSAAFWGTDGAEDGAGVGDGWRGFSVARVRALREAFVERGDEIKGLTKAQANKLRALARLLCRLRVASATESVPDLLRLVVEETDMYK